MRIVQVCPYALDVPGGVQNHVLGLAGWLTAAGHQITVVAPGRLPDPVRRGAGCPTILGTGRGVGLRWNGSVARVSLSPVAHRRAVSAVADLAPDLVHLHEPLAPGIPLSHWRGLEVPLVATYHTATARSPVLGAAGRVHAESLDSLAVEVAVSESARQVVVQHLGRSPEVIPNGFSLHDLSVASDGSWRPDGQDSAGPRLAFLGRIDEPRKGLGVLVEAWPELARRWPGIEVAVAGMGRRTLPTRWHQLGLVDDTERRELLQWCDVFVAPHTGRESFGLVVLEALAAGAKVVASDLPAFADVLAPVRGRGAHLFETGSAPALVAGVESALEGGDHRAAGLEHAARYDWTVVGQRLLHRYQQVLTRGGAPRADLDRPAIGSPTLAE